MRRRTFQFNLVYLSKSVKISKSIIWEWQVYLTSVHTRFKKIDNFFRWPIFIIKDFYLLWREILRYRMEIWYKYKVLRVGSIPTLHINTFEQLFWTTTWRKNSRKAQWQAQLRYLCYCAFLVLFRYAGSEKTWPNHFISISLALVTLPAVIHR